MVGSYDYCPTGNEADLPGGTVLTQQALNNPLRQSGQVYDDNLKDYFGKNGVISEDYRGVGTQTAGLRYGDVLLGTTDGSTLDLAYTSGRMGPSFLAADENCDSASNPEESTADQEGCDISQQTTGEASASDGGGAGITVFPGQPRQGQITIGGQAPPPEYIESQGPPERLDPARTNRK